MRQFSAARRAACWLLVFGCIASAARGQTWNDSVTRALVDRAIARRAQQLADTGLVDYRARAHGYVTFLAQLGEGFPTPPKIIKADELELEVYWRAPNQSKQRIVGRRDTLLLPTDIAYHRDHLGIVQNNFATLIRLGDGDEVRDVPHPLSAAGFPLYDYALTDSFAIGAGSQRIRVYELKVRPKDDRQPRIVGALYLDPNHAEVVRMNVSFTRAAFLDDALEELSVVLENRLVGGRFWLPSRQEIEIKRKGAWLDYPVRGIIRGRWEVGDYAFNLGLTPALFVGPEIVQAPAQVLRDHVWKGRILDSLPPDVRAITDPDIQRVQAEARALVQRRALERARGPRMSARNISDFARFNRVEGLALGGGVATSFGGGVSSNVRARYGFDDEQVKGALGFTLARSSGWSFRIFGLRDFRDVGDVVERSTPVNSLAAQEFASDYTDPYLTRAVGGELGFPSFKGLQSRLTGTYEHQSPLSVNATPVNGTFLLTIPAADRRAARVSLGIDRPTALWKLGTEVTAHADLRWTHFYSRPNVGDAANAWRGAAQARIERPFGKYRLAAATTIAGVDLPSATGVFDSFDQELVYLGGPISAPGYPYHSIATNAAASQHLEWRMPAPFVPFSLGRFGRVPAQGTFAVYGHAVLANRFRETVWPVALPLPRPAFPFRIPQSSETFYPALGIAYVLPFDVIRIDVARGLARGGRWTFNIDVSREFWPIL
jgi:hypothetical protein